MMFKEKMSFRRFERCWKKQGRKDMLTWVYRYLRLHIELLADSVYKEMFDYHRNALVEYIKRDVKGGNASDEEYGELVDALADVYNRNRTEQVNKYKPLVDELYNIWKKD